MKRPAFFSRARIVAGENDALRIEDSGGERTVTVAAGDYFVGVPSGLGLTEFAGAVVAAIDADSPDAYTLTVERFFDDDDDPVGVGVRFTITSDSASFRLLWADGATTLDPLLLGWTTASTSAAADQVNPNAPGAWLSPEGMAEDDRRSAIDGEVEEALDGTVYSVDVGGVEFTRAIELDALPARRTVEEVGDLVSLEAFRRGHFVRPFAFVVLEDDETTFTLLGQYVFVGGRTFKPARDIDEPELWQVGLELRRVDGPALDGTAPVGMSYADAIANLYHWTPVIALDIQGVETVFVDETIAPSSLLGSRPQMAAIDMANPPVVGETRVNEEERYQEGSDLSARLLDLDGSLRQLFAVRRRPSSYLATSIARDASPSTVTVGSTAPDKLYPADGGTFVLNGETFSYTGKTATTFIGVARAQFGSRPGVHVGGAAVGDGAGLYPFPSTWEGRRVQVKRGFRDVEGNVSELENDQVYTLLGPPDDDGRGGFTLRAEHIINTYRRTRVYVGLAPVRADQGDDEFIQNNGFDVPASTVSLFETGNLVTHLLAELEDGRREILKNNGDGPSGIAFDYTGFVQPSGLSDLPRDVAIRGYHWRSLQHVWYFSNPPSVVVPQILLSKLGNGDNDADWDHLPGVERTDRQGIEWRMGAGLDAADVDLAAFRSFEGPRWSGTLHEEVALSDILREYCLATGTIYHANGSGQLTVSEFADSVTAGEAAQVLDADESVILRPTDPGVAASESFVVHTNRLKANFDVFTDRFDGTINVEDRELKERFTGSGRFKEIESKFLSVDFAHLYVPVGQKIQRFGALSVSQLRDMLRSDQKAEARARAEIVLVCSQRAASVQLGQIVQVTDARISDLEGGRLANTTARVIGKQPDPRGFVRLRLRIVQRGVSWAPTGQVTTGTTLTRIELDTSTPWGGLTPGRAFASQWRIAVLLFDAADDRFQTATIDSVGDDFLELDTSLLTIPPNGSWVTVLYDEDKGPIAGGFTPSDAAYQVAADGTHNGVDGTRLL